MSQRTMSTADRRQEPEIIPPGAPVPTGSRLWTATDAPPHRRIHVARVGPIGAVLLALAVGVLLLVMLAVLLGAFVIGLVAFGLFVAAAVVSGILRGPSRRLR